MPRARGPRRADRPPENATVVRAHAWLSGRVQGVGFRYFVQRLAVRRRLAGYVRNLPDRRVEIVAEGPLGDVDALINAARQGPPGAAVQDVRLEWETPAGEPSFRVRTDGSEIYE
jgi:acylphosphatase